MRYLALLLIISSVSFCAVAQNCSDYYYLNANKTVEMTMYNKKGKETGKQVYTISNVTKSGNTTSSTVNVELFDSKGKTASKAVNLVKCTAGVMMMDMKMFIPAAQQQQMGTGTATVSDSFIDYPASMKEGDALKDAQFKMDFKMESGIAGNVSVNISNRKVAGKEQVTTPAGTWDAFKITYKSKIIMKIGIGIPVNMDVTEWYVPGFGVVKSEAGGARTEITTIR
jgi:hypothetical protein